ncbi:hypothetical protein [Candidatus Palauibacter sp.]|uniref:hypothetical protein n=1 Tax=Candidatus Palauibacter sp. TaxID=3101350 RepID=UPI003CC6A83C
MSNRGLNRDSHRTPDRTPDRDVVGDFDRGVILRAHRFRAEIAGYRLVRGHYMDREDDRADRWYVVSASEKNPERTGPGFRTSAAAAREAERRAAAETVETDNTP